MARDFSLQGLIHALEQGRLRVVVQGAVILAATVTLGLAYLGLVPLVGWQFRGFNKPEAMDQAQVSREIARGNGFSTQLIRPLALWQLERHRGAPAAAGEVFPDTFNAPLGPLVNAPLMRRFGDHPEFKAGEFVHPGERAIAIGAMLCFVGATVVNFFTLRRLFDDRLAALACGLVLISDAFWQWTLTGLPQMLMLLLFSLVLYALVRAVAARFAERPGPALGWLAGAGAGLGLVTLAHGLGAWIALGAVVFAAIHFRPRALAAAAVGVTFLLVLSPWLLRNARVSGNPFGLAGYALLDGVTASTAQRMRSPEPLTAGISPLFLRPKLQSGLAAQLGTGLTRALGGSVLAALFFLGLLYPFRKPETAVLRWGVLAMWLAAVVGMALLGWEDDPLGPGNVHILFVPVMLGYGLALALVFFTRLPAGGVPLWRVAFLTGLFALAALPTVTTLMSKANTVVQFPPYFPPGIAKLHAWTEPREIVGADMPWAVAWYADRRSLWIPTKQKEFMNLNDTGKLPGPLAGLLLTPVSRNMPFYSGILKGEYQEWAGLIGLNPGAVNARDFPFHEVAPIIGDISITFFSDRPRWTQGAPAR